MMIDNKTQVVDIVSFLASIALACNVLLFMLFAKLKNNNIWKNLTSIEIPKTIYITRLIWIACGEIIFSKLDFAKITPTAKIIIAI
jgi:hypothetical protein